MSATPNYSDCCNRPMPAGTVCRCKPAASPNAPALKDGRTAYAVIDDGCVMDVYGTRELAAARIIGNPPATYVAPVRWDGVTGQWFIAGDIAAYARDWASDCDWQDMRYGDWAELSDALVITRAARFYDGGMAALVADAGGDYVPADEPDDMPALDIRTLQRIAARAVADHTPDNAHCDCRETLTVILPGSDARNADGHADWCCTITPREPLAELLAPHNVTITAINPPSDSAFDRCSVARSGNESFTIAGIVYRIADYWGTGAMPWRVSSDCDATPRAIYTSEEIARALNAARPHPDPYIGSVECAYDIRGHRALYGVRASGKIEIWQD